MYMSKVLVGQDSASPREEIQHSLVPTRRFGKSGASVSQLCLGGSSVVGKDCTALLDEALSLGITCWESSAFTGRAFGDHFKANPGVRERVFLSAKSRNADVSTMQADLERALADNETSVIDFFAVHGIEDVEVLTEDVQRWAERAKTEGKIRLFGFCTHKRMDHCLNAAADLGWIDGIQVFYNYRMQAIGTMEVALRKCHHAGIGIITVKSMGLCVSNEDDIRESQPDNEQLTAALGRQSLSFEQAKLKAIWQNRGVSSVCSLMPSLAIVRANAAAAADHRALDSETRSALLKYADATASHFCRRCGTCASADPVGLPVFNIMECLMYARAYGSRDLGATLYSRIPADFRDKLASNDYSRVEAACPQRLPIASLMREARAEFGGG